MASACAAFFGASWLLLAPVWGGSTESLTAAEEAFLARHWRYPVAPQGRPPAGFSALESSLKPDSCGRCHVQQHADWTTSLHAASMGPGVLGQLVEMVESDPLTARVCWRCHAPLAEQHDLIASSSGDEHALAINPGFDPDLQRQGLVCAGCHVRRHQRFGPPRVSTPTVTGRIEEELPHGGFTAETAFQKSAFCRGCHQFGADDYALNGKLLENTYEEWRASDFAARGVQCQDCHMPQRRHLWRGIHDAEMVKQGVSISVAVPRREYRKGDTVESEITIENTGVGHHFPTYVTPKVFVRSELLDSSGNIVADTVRQAVIGREITLDLSQEVYDTRIPSGESLSLSYVQTLALERMQLRVEVTVDPDNFYTGFYRALLRSSGGKGRSKLIEALQNAEGAGFIIFEQTVPLYSR